MPETIVIKIADREIGRVIAEKLEYAKVKIPSYWRESQNAEPKDDLRLFTAKDASGKALFVVRVSEDKEVTTEKL